MSSGDYGWGLDVPGVDLEILQNIVGPERYHWHRFSEAEDQVRTYEEKMARLDLPERRLNEEREALSAILNSTDVIHRAADQMILASSMIRPYHDPVDEVHQWRGWGCLRYPYRYSSWPMWGLAPADRRVAAPSGGRTEPVGEVLMVVQAGARRPIELGGHSWASTR